MMEPITETWWPRFREAVEADIFKRRPIQLACSICQELITTNSSEPSHSNVDGTSHAAVIIPCGHIVGLSCLIRWLVHSNRPERNYSRCPACNAKCFHHPRCGHRCMGRMLPGNPGKYSTIPPVLSAGGVVAPECSKCEAKLLLRQLCKYAKIYPTLIPAPGRDQYIGFGLLINGIAAVYTPPPLDKQGVDYRRTSDVVINSGLSTVWNINKQIMALKASRFWYEIDLTALEFTISIFQSGAPSPKNPPMVMETDEPEIIGMDEEV
ncbi:hypothetical protein F66182_6684 [Fusarium sp. NRRL 66182]|nr:hypothetical protein F66182_6684 [Fusarium sp. NRRL 66182]